MMWGVFMVDGEVLRYIEGQVAWPPPEGWSLMDDDGAISTMCETWRVSPSELVGAMVDRAKRGQRDFERRVERGEDPWLRMWNDGQELRIPRPDAGSPLLAHAEDLGVACHLAGRTDHGRGLASGDEAAVRRGVADAWHSVPECTTVRSR